MGTQETHPGRFRAEIPAQLQMGGVVPKSRSEPLLSAAELSVVALSLRDEPSSIAEPTTISWLIEKLTGRRPSNRLANPRLERLRRYCVALRVTPLLPPDHFIRDLLAIGYSWEAIAEVSEIVALGMQDMSARAVSNPIASDKML